MTSTANAQAQSDGAKTKQPQNRAAPPIAPAPDAIKLQPPPEPAPLPNGEVVADLGKDFAPEVNGHPDTAKSGRWLYLGSHAANPWEDAPKLGQMSWWSDSKKAKSFYRWSSAEPSDAGLTATVEGVPDKGALLTSDSKVRSFAVARWLSGANSDLIIQGSFAWNAPSKACVVEGFVFVDGIQKFRDRLTEYAQNTRFRVEAQVMPGSAVDFVVGLRPESLRRMGTSATLLSAVIVRSKEATVADSDRQIVKDVSDTLRKFPKRGLPRGSDVSNSMFGTPARVAWWNKTFTESYRKIHSGEQHRNPFAQQFLEAFALRYAQDPKALSAGEMRILANQIDPHDDAVLLALDAYLLKESEELHDRRLASDWFTEAEALLKHQAYPPIVGAWIYCTHASIYTPADMRSPSYQDFLLSHATSYLVQAAMSPDIANSDRVKINELVLFDFDPETTYNARSEVIGQFVQQQTVDPWVREVALAHEYVRLAWLARGNGAASTVSRESFLHFEIDLAQARLHALRAWKLQPELPQGASIMITITMAGQPVQKEDCRFWFDEAVRADFQALDAYRQLYTALRPRWGGSLGAMLALARECLATKRFDTRVPSQFHEIMSDIRNDVGTWEGVVRAPGVYNDYIQLYKGLEKAHPEVDFRSRVAAISYLAGKKDVTRRILSELGPGSDRTGFRRFGLYYSEVARRLRYEDRPPKSYFPDDPLNHLWVTFAPVTNRLWAASVSDGIEVWNVETRMLEKTLTEHSAPIMVLEQVPGSKQVLTASLDGKVVIWNPVTMAPEKTLDLKRPLHSAAARADGAEVVIAVGDGPTTEFILWDVVKDSQTTEKMDLDSAVNKLALTADSKRVFYSISDPDNVNELHSLFVWDRSSGEKRSLKGLTPYGLSSWTYSPLTSELILGAARMIEGLPEGNIETFDAFSEQKKNASDQHTTLVSGIVPLSGAGRIVAGRNSGSVAIWNEASIEVEGCIEAGFSPVHSLTVSADERWIAAINRDGRLNVWPTQNKRLDWQIVRPLLDANLGGKVRLMKFVDGSKKLFIDTTEGVSLWDWGTGCQTAECFFGDPRLHFQTKPLDDGNTVAAIWKRDAAFGFSLLDYRKGTTVYEMNFGAEVTRFAISPNSRIAALGDVKGQIQLFDLKTHEPLLARPLKLANSIWALQFTPDSKSLLVSDGGLQITRWEIPSPITGSSAAAEPTTYNVGFGPPRAIVISDNGSMAIHVDDRLTGFEPARGQQLFTRAGVLATFSPDSARLLIVSGSGPAQTVPTLWDTQLGQKVLDLGGAHHAAVTSAVFSPDGAIVLTGDALGFVHAWDVKTGSELLQLPGSAK